MNKRIANEFNVLQKKRNMCSQYSVKSYVSVSFVPGLEKMSLVVISMEGVKAFEKSAMDPDVQLLHNQINILVFERYW